MPEALRNPDASVNALYGFGEHSALGFSPFGIESIDGHAARLLCIKLHRYHRAASPPGRCA